MDRSLSFSVPSPAHGLKASDFLKGVGISRTLQVSIKRQGSLLLNGSRIYASTPVSEGDIVSVSIAEEKISTNIAPEEGPLDILYEDEDILAVNKPAELAVHPSRAHVYGTLAGRVMYYYRDERFMFRAVNRLDRGTSGIVLVAKNPFAANWLSSGGDIKKEYIGFAAGSFPPDTRIISFPIAREEGAGIKRIVSPEGESAVTRCSLIETREAFSVVSFALETGRTHQIRVHSSFIGHPLLGDPLYNPDPQAFPINRQALHAAGTNLILPFSNKRLSLSAPLPLDMAMILSKY